MERITSATADQSREKGEAAGARSAAQDDAEGSIDGRSDDYATAGESEDEDSRSLRGSPEKKQSRHHVRSGLREPGLVLDADLDLAELQFIGRLHLHVEQLSQQPWLEAHHAMMHLQPDRESRDGSAAYSVLNLSQGG